MRRRDFIKAIAGSTAAWPLAARAQQAVMPVVGFLSSRSPNESASVITAFKQGLQEQGFIERYWHRADIPAVLPNVRFWA